MFVALFIDTILVLSDDSIVFLHMYVLFGLTLSVKGLIYVWYVNVCGGMGAEFVYLVHCNQTLHLHGECLYIVSDDKYTQIQMF
jgi:hypothetical protein